MLQSLYQQENFKMQKRHHATLPLKSENSHANYKRLHFSYVFHRSQYGGVVATTSKVLNCYCLNNRVNKNEIVQFMKADVFINFR